MKQVPVSRIKAGKDLKASINKAVRLIGGWKRFGLRGKRVLLKPNFNTDDPFPASSDPEFIRLVIEILYENGAKKVILGESCTHSMRTEKVLCNSRMKEIAEEAGAKVFNFDKHSWVKKSIPGAKYLKSAKIPAIFDRVDKVVFVSCLKTHKYARFTGAIKLTMGAVKKLQRMFIHFGHLEQKFAELAALFKPDLVIMDARKVFVTEGPAHGDVREPGLIFASTDRIALDVEGVKLLKSYNAKNRLTPPTWETPQIKRAVEMGIGVKSEKEYKVVTK